MSEWIANLVTGILIFVIVGLAMVGVLTINNMLVEDKPNQSEIQYFCETYCENNNYPLLDEYKSCIKECKNKHSIGDV